MKKCAIILNGSDVVKVSNLKRKYNKFVNNPDVTILEECDEDQLEDKYNYWCRTINYKAPEQEEENPLKYHWRNKITGYTHHSIYPHMNNIPDIKLDEWEQYENL